MNTLLVILFALSLCADCFAVSICSGIALKDAGTARICFVALVFAVIQSGFLFAGWAFGDMLASAVSRVADWIGFGLLVYVSSSMLLSSFRGGDEALNLNGMRNVLTGGAATSIDALAVGMSLSMAGESLADISLKTLAVFVFTFLSVVAGLAGGHVIGRKFGRAAVVLGAAVLLFIAFNILFDFV